MRIAIIGAGGIGAYYGARLQRAGHQVSYVARGAQLQALREQGLQIEHPEFRFAEPVQACDIGGLCRDAAPEDFDLLVLAVKAGATAEIAGALAQWFESRGGGCPVLSLQNGVDNEAILADRLGSRWVLGGLAIRIGTHVEAPGRIGATGVGQIVAGVWPNTTDASDTPAAAALAEAAEAWPAAGIPFQISPDIRRELWRKLVINNGVNPISAITGWDSGRLTRDEEIAPMVRRMMRETAAAAAADGVELAEADVAEMFGVIHDLDPIKTSMLVDREHGRPLEVDAICGPVLERSERLGIEAPATALAAALLRRGIWP